MSRKLLEWTGHPLVDVGIATLCQLCGRAKPEELTLEDLDDAAEQLRGPYFSGVLNSYLTCVFMNSEYVQPGGGAAKEQSRNAYSERVLFAHRWRGDPEAAGLTCVFSGQPATHVVHRGQVPMITGEGVLNFFPRGIGGLAVAGPYLTAVQAVPMGGRRAEGKLLIVHADEPGITLSFAGKYLADNRRLISTQPQWPSADGPDPRLPREQGAYDTAKKRAKYPDAKRAQTLVTADLIEVLELRHATQHFERIICMVTAYWLSSSGQGPSLSLFQIPGNLVGFLDRASKADVKPLWRVVVGSGWPHPTPAAPQKRGKKTPAPLPPHPGVSRNAALEHLIRIFANGTADANECGSFLRRFVFPLAQKHTATGAFWPLTELFLLEIVGMTASQIDSIKSFADRLADYVNERRARPFLKSLLYARSNWLFRNALVKEQRREFLMRGAGDRTSNLLFGLDDYLATFGVVRGSGVDSWSLVRDLISIRLVERLHELNVGDDVLPEAEEEETEADEVVAGREERD